MRVIAHLDLDACFASIEQRDNPELRGKPVIVGAPPTQRGVVAACSYEARKFGVHSAMPSVTAGRLCPNAVFVRPRMEVYRTESRLVMQLIAESGGVVEQTSIDEAYIDLTSLCPAEDQDSALLMGMPFGRMMKERIRSERQLTATVGIGPNKLLAKIGSDKAKPDGLLLIPDTGKSQFHDRSRSVFYMVLGRQRGRCWPGQAFKRWPTFKIIRVTCGHWSGLLGQSYDDLPSAKTIVHWNSAKTSRASVKKRPSSKTPKIEKSCELACAPWPATLQKG